MQAQVSGYGMRVRLGRTFPEALQAAKEALAEQGFGALTEIDVRATLRKKTDADLGYEYVIIGACNPRLAYRALTREKEIGLFLPCNLVVYEDGGEAVVSAINPLVAMEGVGNADLEEVAEEATARLKAAVESLA